MKILFVGHLNAGQTSLMRMEALRELGHEVATLNVQRLWDDSRWVSRRIQQWAGRGPVVSVLNGLVSSIAKEFGPELLWAEKQEHIRPETLLALKASGCRLLHFTPDPYFTLAWKRTALMDACLPLFDYLATSKRYELEAYRATGAQVIYMPLGFSYSVHRPVLPASPSLADVYESDIGFVGGWEPRRESLLTQLAPVAGRTKIWGYAWDHLANGRWSPRRHRRLQVLAGRNVSVKKNLLLAGSVMGGEVYADEYAYCLTGAKISVGFLRTICPDQHTTRTFEIPACGSMLLADRTPEHQEFFDEGSEAEYFSSDYELIDKARFYLSNPSSRESIASKGYQRAITSGYSYTDRVKSVLAEIE